MSAFYSLLLGVLAWCLWPAAEGLTLSAVKKSGAPKTSAGGAPDNVLDLVDIVSGRHEDAVAVVTFTNSINENGWSFLDIEDTRSNLSDKRTLSDIQLAVVAGVLEGNLTASLIQMHWQNTFSGYCDDQQEYCDRLVKFIDDNYNFCLQLYEDLKNPANYQASLWFTQLRGMADGYAAAGYKDMGYNEFLMLQIAGDLEDLESALGGGGGGEGGGASLSRRRVVGSGSCSALVMLLPQNQDLYVAHDTWGGYNSMLRIFKRYNLRYAISDNQLDSTVPGSVQVFSSYPGVIHSGDDYYLINSGLVTLETTIGNSNPDLWQYVTPSNLFEPVRVVLANRLATSGSEWTSYFSANNMGTYNNQWMVVDYKLFVPGDIQLKDGLLWIAEQIPGTVLSSDQTDMLRTKSYWPSYNIPYQATIYNLSGVPELVAKYGDWFSWSGAPRAKIFARNISNVVDLQSMIALMRYNNFKEDDLSECKCNPPYSGENAISARSDLNPASGTYPFSALGHRSHGGTDMKVTSSGLMSNMECMAVSGPTHDQQPIFQWSTSGLPDKHLGHPDVWDFDPITIKWDK